jgi:hypothetical protein
LAEVEDSAHHGLAVSEKPTLKQEENLAWTRVPIANNLTSCIAGWWLWYWRVLPAIERIVLRDEVTDIWKYAVTYHCHGITILSVTDLRADSWFLRERPRILYRNGFITNSRRAMTGSLILWSVLRSVETWSGNLPHRQGLYSGTYFFFVSCIVIWYPWHYGCCPTVLPSYLWGISTRAMTFILSSINQPFASEIGSAWAYPLPHSPIGITSPYCLSLPRQDLLKYCGADPL